MKVVQIEQISNHPYSLSEVKSFCRIIGDEDNNLLTALINVALIRAEEITNIYLKGVARFELYLDTLRPSVTLPMSGVIQIEKVEHLVSGEWKPVDSYYFDSYALPQTIEFANTSYTLTNDRPRNNVRITYKAGSDVVNETVYQWLKVQVSTMYEHRESIVVGANVSTVPNIDCLLSSMRVIPV